MVSAALTGQNLHCGRTWVSGCNQQDVFPLCLAVQSLRQAQLTAGRQAEHALVIPTAQHVAQLAVGTLVIVSGNNLEKNRNKISGRFWGSNFFLQEMCFSFPAEEQQFWNK